MTNRKLIFALSLILIRAFCVAALQTDAPKLPATEAGQRVDGYIKAFNTGDEKAMRTFLSANVSEEAIKRRSIDERVQIYKEMLSNMKSLELRRILNATPDTVTGLFKTGNGEWFEIGFQFEPASPHKLLGLRVEDSDPPTEGVAPSHPVGGTHGKMTEQEFLAKVEKRLGELVATDEFSGTVLIARHGKPIFQKAYGLSSKEYNVVNQV